ncbi:MAG: sulfate adenylyltransferase [Rhodocyclaceae bacterium]|jgi:sulfate adenylyltransferase|nr:sulfate adenylyltransferase [Rhodocyclaceae bacterium]MBK6676680.1 sulfate adenylyltransferase [Rhodocyclaceae bacterium]MBK9309305.1 sulfate adenylyltransferase [Rhodocyclaceae bacterium]
MALVNPHGSSALKPLLLQGGALESERARATTLPRLKVSSREAGDIIMLGIGGFTPLDGFMTHSDWQGVCDGMKMASGLFWPIPVTLSTDDESIKAGDEIALADGGTGEILAIMRVSERYTIDKAHECMQVFKTTDLEHPGVKMVMAQGKCNLAGPVKVLSTGGFKEKYGEQFMTPAETRARFEQLGWQRIAAFQTRNPMHRSHEYLTKIAIETMDGVLVHSLLGNLKPGDIPAEVRSEAIEVLIRNYFAPNTVIQAGYPLDMRYAGPREALLHALFRQNYGCSHLIVGRDHAGVGDYYGPFDAQKIFDEIPRGSLETVNMNIDWTFWCNKCGGMCSQRTCPHTKDDRILLSGTKVRAMLSEGQDLPVEFSRPEVAAVLKTYYRGLTAEQNVKVELKGHSAA